VLPTSNDIILRQQKIHVIEKLMCDSIKWLM
jgi:hypothetical protein